MAGYDGFSKSNNAIYAESEDKFPATVAAKKLGVSAAAIKAILSPCEWHHTGKMYNRTDYYYIGELLEAKGGNCDDAEICETWQKLKAYKKEAEKETFMADVKFLTWEGTRKHPKAIKHSAENVTVEKNGKKYTIYMPDGIYVKMEGSNGTLIKKI